MSLLAAGNSTCNAAIVHYLQHCQPASPCCAVSCPLRLVDLLTPLLTTENRCCNATTVHYPILSAFIVMQVVLPATFGWSICFHSLQATVAAVKCCNCPLYCNAVTWFARLLPIPSVATPSTSSAVLPLSTVLQHYPLGCHTIKLHCHVGATLMASWSLLLLTPFLEGPQEHCTTQCCTLHHHTCVWPHVAAALCRCHCHPSPSILLFSFIIVVFYWSWLLLSSSLLFLLWHCLFVVSVVAILLWLKLRKAVHVLW